MGKGNGATGPMHWEKRVTTLGQCGKRRREEKNKKKYRLTAGSLTKRAKRIYKNVSNVQNLIFK
jgi:hypothetical protein